MVELYQDDAPTHCAHGHRLGPNRVIVSPAWCSCDKVGPSRVHMSWRCRVCGHLTYSDGHTDDTKLAQPPRPLMDVLRIDPE